MSDQPVSILRIALTTPCPVRVMPDGSTLDADGEPIPNEDRPELCAVDAEWMIGNQRVCDVHLRLLFDQGWLTGSFEGLIEETFASYGDWSVAQAKERMLRPWSVRKRYSQEDAASWAEKDEALV